MPAKSRIVIAEDHTIIREGLRSLLTSDPDFEIVGEAENGLQAVQCIEKLRPDLVLMDISMPRMDGLEAIRRIREHSPDTKILVLTVHKNEEYILATLQAGADGYALKYVSHAELVSAIKTVLRGETYLSPAVSQVVLGGYLEGKKALKRRSSMDSLTPREREILRLVAEGYKNREIAERLYISVKTAETHRSNLMKKLDLHSAAALTAFAIENRIIQ
ncbi:MAG: response regulator transcription factor [Desulfomonile tiedjei]|nr:response regulator transcription factor [Desulfomonile tiedjei]